MAERTKALLNNAKFFVGSKLTRLRGAADDYFTISKASDVGSSIGGIQGDTMHIARVQNLYTATLTLISASKAVGVLLALQGNSFPVKVQFNDFELVGSGIITNVGDWVASLTGTTRNISMNVSYISGNVLTGVGELDEV